MSTRAKRMSQPVVVAMVLGTALSTLGSGSVSASQVTPQSITAIGRYCTTCWRNARLPTHAWNDCTQEVFRRLLERVPATSWSLALRPDGEERREFLRAIDAVKKRTQRARRFSDDVERVADSNADVERRRTEDREVVERVAAEVLSDRQRQIVRLSLDGHSVQDIGEALALPVERVSDEKYKAIRKLRDHLA